MPSAELFRLVSPHKNPSVLSVSSVVEVRSSDSPLRSSPLVSVHLHTKKGLAFGDIEMVCRTASRPARDRHSCSPPGIKGSREADHFPIPPPPKVCMRWIAAGPARTTKIAGKMKRISGISSFTAVFLRRVLRPAGGAWCEGCRLDCGGPGDAGAELFRLGDDGDQPPASPARPSARPSSSAASARFTPICVSTVAICNSPRGRDGRGPSHLRRAAASRPVRVRSRRRRPSSRASRAGRVADGLDAPLDRAAGARDSKHEAAEAADDVIDDLFVLLVGLQGIQKRRRSGR